MKRVVFTLGVLLAGCLALADGPVELDDAPVFLGPVNSDISASRVHLTNKSDQRQLATVTVGGTIYPVTIPAFGETSFLDFRPPSAGSVDEREAIVLAARPVSGQGESTHTSYSYFVQPAPATPCYLQIGKGGSLLSWYYGGTRDTSHALPPSQATAVGYECLPQDAPDRPVAYQPFSAIFINGEAAPLISDSAISALTDYVLEGGLLMLPPNLTDPRFKSIEKLSGRGAFEGLGMVIRLPRDPFAPGAKEEIPSRESEPYKQTSAYVAVQLLKMELDEVPHWNRVADVLPSVAGEEVVAPYTLNRLYNANAPDRPDRMHSDDPFAASLPPFMKILGLVCLYFLLVVPLNLFILRRFGKPELAWISAPALAICFAAVFFNSSNLRHTQPSHANHGVLIVQEGLPDAIFAGTSDLFIPKAGQTDLGLKNADQAFDKGRLTGAPLRQPVGDNPQNSTTWVNVPAGIAGAVDTGTVNVPRLQTTNLSFKQIGLVQRLQAPGWFAFKTKPDRYGLVKCFVTNHSPYTVRGACLSYSGLYGQQEDLGPGKTISLLAGVGMNQANRGGPVGKFGGNAAQPNSAQNIGFASTYFSSGGGLRGVISGRGQLVLLGEIDDAPVGCDLGQEVTSRTHIDLCAFARPSLRLDK